MYKLYKSHRTGEIVGALKTNDDGSTVSFLLDIPSTEQEAYLTWLEEGNTPMPADQGEQQ